MRTATLLLLLAANFAQLYAQIALQFEVQLKEAPPNCASLPPGEQCKVPYALSLLNGKAQDFDLGALMMQDGHLYGTEEKLLESTVLRIPRMLQVMKGEHIFAGLKLYGLPEQMQDYFLLDITKMVTGHSTGFSQSVVTPSISAEIRAKSFKIYTLQSNSPCGCSGYACGCCEHLNVPRIQLNETGCANVTYLPKDYGFSLTFSLNGIVFYNDTVSARNPPPVCFNVPHLKEYASLCLRLHDIDVSSTKASACVLFQAELYHMRIYERELGCFDIPLAGDRSVTLSR